jgi:hypothetical protein
MRSLERRFEHLQKVRPEVSTLINFAGAVMRQEFSVRVIHLWFNKLVSLEDYIKEEKRYIIKFLVSLSGLEEGTK